jgi:hypothetical protein
VVSSIAVVISFAVDASTNVAPLFVVTDGALFDDEMLIANVCPDTVNGSGSETLKPKLSVVVWLASWS